MNILITICARGGSKGIPGKNIKPINNKPLLHYTLETAYKFSKKLNCDIQLSTDSHEILNCAKSLDYNTDYIRPDYLATDNAGKIEVIREAWKYAEDFNNKRYDMVLDMDVTSPLRTIEDLEEALNKLKSNNEALNLFSVNNAARNPYFNMVEENSKGFVQLVKDAGKFKSRQEVPKVYDMNASFYFYKREFMESELETAITPKSIVYEMPHICFDVDHPVDFTILDLMLQNNLLDFSL
jgi:CMP-N,N'-diacetyllegionaminic acid synthase